MKKFLTSVAHKLLWITLTILLIIALVNCQRISSGDSNWIPVTIIIFAIGCCAYKIYPKPFRSLGALLLKLINVLEN